MGIAICWVLTCRERFYKYRSHFGAARRAGLFGSTRDVGLFDLTSTYFEVDGTKALDSDLQRHGYSRDKRGDCLQVMVALVLTPDGFPLAYEVMPGNTSDKGTQMDFIPKLEAKYGQIVKSAGRRVASLRRGVWRGGGGRGGRGGRRPDTRSRRCRSGGS